MSWSGLVTIANSVLIWVFMARMRDADEVGRFTIAMGLYALFYSAVSLGLLPYLIKEMARRDRSERHTLISNAMLLLAISGVASALLMSAAAFVISGSSEVRIATAILSLAMLPTALMVVCDAVAISTGRARAVAAVTTAENIVRTLLPLWLIWNGYDIIVICASFALIRFFSFGAYLVVCRLNIVKLTIDLSELRLLAAVCPTFAATISLASLNWQAPLILLGYLSTEAETASFGVASRFLIPVAILMGAYANTIQGALVTKLQNAPQNFAAYISKLAVYPVAASLVAVVGSVLFSAAALRMLFGSAYESASMVLIILAVSTIPFCIVMVVARALVAVNLQRVDLIANALGVAVSIATAAMLIPRYGAVGAAFAQLFSFILMALIETVYLARSIEGVTWPSESIPSTRPNFT